MALVPAKHELSHSQKQAIEFLVDFTNSKNLVACLIGYAGTGKTYLLKYFLNDYFKGNSCVSAPTHKAVRIVEQQLLRKGRTLQSLLGLRVNTNLDNFDISNPSFDPMGNEYIKNYNLIVIDECSMVNVSLFTLLIQKAKAYNTKVLFVGDNAQLPPIKEKISLTFLCENKFTLTSIIRQKADNPLLIILDIIRNDILNNTDDFYDYVCANRRNINDKNEGYVILNEPDFKKSIVHFFNSNSFTNNIDHVRTLAYTNDAVGKWNKFIRDELFNNPTDILIKHDLLTAYTTITDDYLNPIIINSEDYILSNIRKYTTSAEIETYAINLRAINGALESKTLNIVDHTKTEGFKHFYKILRYLHNNAISGHGGNSKSSLWAKYYRFKNEYLSMLNFTLNKDLKAFVKKDIDYGYGLTVHKSQGSTYNNVCVDLADIVHNYNLQDDKNLRDRLIYVALSRATTLATMKL